MDDNKDGKSKYNKESILRNWKTLKQCIEPLDFVRELQRCNFLPKSSFEHLGSKSRSHQATLVLIKVYIKVQSSKKEYQKFVEILRRYNSTAADALTNPVRGPINTGIVDKHPIEQTSELLKRFEKEIKDKLKRHPDVVLDITDNFIGYGLLEIDTVEQILHSPKESHERLVEFVITNNLPGTYNLMLETLKSEKKLKGLVSGSSTAANQETRRDFPDDTRDPQILRRNIYNKLTNILDNLDINDVREIFIEREVFSSSMFDEIEKTYSGSENHMFAVLSAIINSGPRAMRTLVDVLYINQLDSLADSILRGTLNEMKVIKGHTQTAIGNTTSLKIERTQSEQQTTVSVQHTMNVTIIAVNRSFLIEEISTMILVRAFQDQGITCFDGLDGTLGRQQRAEHFLTILEENNLLDQLLVILREQGMTYVLDRFNNCRNAYSADPQILRRNIFKNRTNILDNLDIDDVREIFIEREVISSSIFDEIEKKYSESEDQMNAVLIEIIKSGKPAMRILVDVLYISQLDSLADNLLRRTPNDMQEMEDNTQTDESSSDDELLYEGTYVVSKADAKQETRRGFPDDTRAKQETRRGFPDDTRAKQETRRDFRDVTRETADEFTSSINGKTKNPEMISALQAPYLFVDNAVVEYTGSTREKEKEGSTMFGLKKNCSKNVITLQCKTQLGAVTSALNDLIEQSKMEPIYQNNNTCNMNTGKQVSQTSSIISALPSIALTQSEKQKTESVHHTTESVHHTTESAQHTTESTQHTTESAQHTMNATIIAANRSFLIEEINTMSLFRAFQDRRITCFDGLDDIHGRQQRAEYFLTILERNNLLDQLLDILREQGMAYMLDRLNNCRNAYSADPQILERNIFNNRTNILDNLDIDDVREIFVEREVFNSSMFDEIEEKYSGSEDQMSAVLIEIIKSGPRAMRILVDALYINQLDSLPDSLIRRTPNELQEIQDNTQIDESSSDGELLYGATYIVSKSVEKPPSYA